MVRNTNADDRSESTKLAMAEHFEEFEADYRDDDMTNGEVVYEDDQVVVYRDDSGHELNEWATDLGVDRGDLSETMHRLARDVMGETDAHDAFSYSDPVVFDRLEGDAE